MVRYFDLLVLNGIHQIKRGSESMFMTDCSN